MRVRTRQAGRLPLALTGLGLLLLLLLLLLVSGPTEVAATVPRHSEVVASAAGAVVIPGTLHRDDRDLAPAEESTTEPRARWRAGGGDPIPGDLAAPPIRLGTEQGHYRALIELLGRDPEAFRQKLDEVHTDSVEITERVAALRVWYDRGITPRLAPFARVLRAANPKPVRDYALRFLVQRARGDASIRTVLAEYLDAGPAGSRCRAEALFGVLRWGDDAELQGRWQYLDRELDPGVLSRAVGALRDSDAPVAPAMLARLQRRLRR